MPKFDIERAPTPDDPNRCQSSVAQGQCPNLAYRTPEGNYLGDKCVMHGGHAVAAKYHAQATRQYKLTRFAGRITDFVTNPNIKSLREEIAILRILIEERMNAIKPDNEFSMIAASGPVSEMIVKLEKLVKSCHAIEKDTGITLDKNQVMAIGDQIITAVINHIEDLALPEDTTNSLLAHLSADIDKIFRGETIHRNVTVTDTPISKNATVTPTEESDIPE